MQEPWKKYAQLLPNGSETPAAIGPWTKYKTQTAATASDGSHVADLQRQKIQFPTSEEQGGPAGQAVMPVSLLDRVRSMLPSPRTVARVGGGVIGGGIGLVGGTVFGTPIGGIAGGTLGGAAGASIGESAYQLAGRLTGQGGPQTSGEAATEQAGALAQGALQEGIPAAVTSEKFLNFLGASGGKRVAEAVQAGNQAIKIKRATAKVGEKAVDTFPVRLTSGTLLNKLESNAANAVTRTNKAYADATATGTSIESRPIIEKLQQSMQRYFHKGKPIAGAEPRISAYEDVIEWLRDNPQFDAAEFRNVKQVWDDIAQPSRLKGAFSPPDPAKAEALKKASDEVRSVIHNVFPATARADETAHVWITLKNVLSEAADKGIGMESMKRLIPRTAIGGTLGASINLGRGESPYEGALVGAALGNLTQTTAWNSLSVAERALLRKILASNLGKVAAHSVSGAVSGATEEWLDRK